MRYVTWTGWVATCWLGMAAPVWAQTGGEGGEENSWGISWALILLSVILGLIVTLKSGRRTSEVKRHKAP